MPNRIKLLLVDDHFLVREGLASVLGREADVEVCGEASSAEEALGLVPVLRPNVIVMDVRLPGMDGLLATQRVRATWPDCRVVILSNHAGGAEILAAFRAGASAYLSKSVEPAELLRTIRQVASGQSCLPPQLASRLATTLPIVNLSPREQTILQHLARGLGNAEIAGSVGITEGTVKNHVSRILEKLGVAHRTEAVVVAGRLGLVRLDED